MKKKTQRVQFRCTVEDWVYFNELRMRGISITEHIMNSVTTTDSYKNYYTMING